ncbi:hypothetical protein Smp_198830 [Schistosoma mansoni]|nr:hypothetical protein Smp_198830 [Schistosoma mansoni]|eukprot:XP_018646346.1 hypothetical protein Smp_198830 [Schistosoma mansoni]
MFAICPKQKPGKMNLPLYPYDYLTFSLHTRRKQIRCILVMKWLV